MNFVIFMNGMEELRVTAAKICAHELHQKAVDLGLVSAAPEHL